MSETTLKLEACPFCGSSEILVEEISPTHWGACCEKCCSQVHRLTRKAAIEAWNARPSGVVELREALEHIASLEKSASTGPTYFGSGEWDAIETAKAALLALASPAANTGGEARPKVDNEGELITAKYVAEMIMDSLTATDEIQQYILETMEEEGEGQALLYWCQQLPDMIAELMKQALATPQAAEAPCPHGRAGS